MLREVFRHYISLKHDSEGSHFSLTICEIEGCTQSFDGGIHKGHAGPCDLLTVNFVDLQQSLKKLSPRKKQAVYFNVIRDMKQKDVAAIMGITTVSVGQYVEQAMIQVAKDIWPETE